MTLRGSTSDFPLESVIGLLAGTSKTGELQVRSGTKVGALGFAGGRLVAAVMDDEAGENALGAIFSISQGDFEFTPWETAPDANLEAGDLVSVLKRAAEARDRLTAIRASIPDDHMRFRLSEKAADGGAVTFTPDRWRALLAVNGERDVVAVAEQLRLGKMQTLTLLVGLVKEGVIEVLPAAASPMEAPREVFSAAEPSAPAQPERAPTVSDSASPAHDWSAPSPAEPGQAVAREPERDWSSGGASWQAPESATQERPQATPERTKSAPDWTKEPPDPPPATESAARRPEVREDLQAEIAQRIGGFGPVPEPPAQGTPAPSGTRSPGIEVPPAVDDRLASLSGLFAPGPAASGPTPKAPVQGKAEPAVSDSGRTAGSPAESWMTPPPASNEAPANAWAPGAQSKDAPANADPWGAPAAPQKEGGAPAPVDEWAPPARQPSATATTAEKETAEKEKKKSGRFLDRFRREETPTPIAHIEPASPSASKVGKLASLSNALLMEYNSGGYGKGKIETRLSNLLMRVDEQADPIDRPLPVVDDLIDAAALEREGFDEQQAVPYLATLVRQIYEDAERAFGKDKAKKGYRAAQQQVFGGDANALESPDLAGKLPKV